MTCLGAKLFGIVHDPVEEEKCLPRIKPYLRPGRTLLVEHFSLYPLIVRVAKRAGMKVFSLDSKFARKLLGVAGFGLMERYVDITLRQKSWLPRLRQAKEGDIALMFPSHARAVAKALNWPKDKIIFIQKLPPFYEARSIRPPSRAEATAVKEYILAAKRKFRRNRAERLAMLNSMPYSTRKIRKFLRQSNSMPK